MMKALVSLTIRRHKLCHIMSIYRVSISEKMYLKKMHNTLHNLLQSIFAKDLPQNRWAFIWCIIQ